MPNPKVNPIPDGFRNVTPYLTQKGCGDAIAFYAKAFGAETLLSMPGPGGKGICHAEIKIGDSMIMMGEEWPGSGSLAPSSLHGTTVGVHLYVPDCDAWADRAAKAGAKVLMPATDMPWGDRFAKLQDPFGHLWTIATHTEDLAPEEIERRMDAAFKSPDCKG